MTEEEKKIKNKTNRLRVQKHRAKMRSMENDDPETYKRWRNMQQEFSATYYKTHKPDVLKKLRVWYKSNRETEEEKAKKWRDAMLIRQARDIEKDKIARQEYYTFRTNQGYRCKSTIDNMYANKIAVPYKWSEYDAVADTQDERRIDRHDHPRITNHKFPKRDDEKNIVATDEEEQTEYMNSEAYKHLKHV